MTSPASTSDAMSSAGPSLEDTAHIRRADVLWRSTLGGVIIRRPGADEVTKLAGTGLALWAALDEPATFTEVCAALADTHDADAQAIATDLGPVIDDLVARRVLDVQPAHGDSV